jgi:hypothetical protein
MLCGRFEYFGSYWGNRGLGWSRMGRTGGLGEWGSAKRYVDLNKTGLLLVRIWVLALLFWVIGISHFATHHMRHLF